MCGSTPSLSIPGAGEFDAAPPRVICATFSASVSRPTRSATRSAIGNDVLRNGKNGAGAGGGGVSDDGGGGGARDESVFDIR